MVRALASMLISEKPRPILVQGGPGMGKTELTKAAALDDEVAERFGVHRYFVALATAKTVKEMQDAIVRAVGCEPRSDFHTALAKLRPVDVLIVLDNLETPWEAEPQAAEATLDELASLPKISIIASFRGSDIEGPDWKRVPVDAFPSDTARDLFVEIAGPWAKQDPCLHNFIEALSGIPLAISLVARRAYSGKDLTPLWQEWERRRADFIKREGVPASALTSLPFSIDLSFDSPRIKEVEDAGRLFSFLGRLPSGLSLEDCRALLGDTAYRAREGLLNAGLAVPEGPRINLLTPIREHARRHHPPVGEDNTRWITTFLEKAEGFEASAESMNSFFKSEEIYKDIHNINEALLSAFDNELEIDLLHHARQCVLLSNQLEIDYSNVLDKIVDREDIFRTERYYDLGLMKATILLNKGEHIAALNLSEEIFNACSAQSNERGMAQALFTGGTILLLLEEFTPALEFLENSLRHFQNIDDEEGERNVEPLLISALTHLGSFDEARKIIHKSKIYSNRNENFSEISRNISFYAACGDFELMAGDARRASEYYTKCADYARHLGALKVELRMLLLLIERHSDFSQQHDQVCRTAERALELCQLLGNGELEGELRSFIAEISEEHSEQRTQ